ncbi:secretion/DNA translocation related TadE-like protein [Arthrobacter roseus]|nr:secretion/DNA translocation related TadE-like protein [Arthrobacter roseus]
MMAGIAFAILLLLAMLVILVQATVGASRASTAADLAALAAADVARGLTPGEPCAVAGEVASRHGVELKSCQQVGAQGHIVDVTTSVHISSLLGSANGRARAGPPPDLP